MNWSQIRNALRRMDWSMIFAVAALLVVGIFFIYSAVNRNDDLPVAPFYQKQMMWALV